MKEPNLHKMLANGERVTLECKKARTCAPNSVWKTYSAFANTYGGTILLGVFENTIEKDLQKRFRMDYIDKSDLIGDQRYSDRITYEGRWENILFNFIRIVIPRLTRDLPRPFRMEGVIRKDDTPQHKAVREALINAIIHADFRLNGILKVEKYDDRFVLTNPGLLKLPVEQIYAGGESKARNQRMQAMLRMIGYGENLGSGFPLILSAWNEKHWLKPELVEQPELMQVKLILHIEDKEEKAFVSQSPTKNVQKDILKELTERQLIMLDLIKKNVQIKIEGSLRKAHIKNSGYSSKEVCL